MSEEELIDHDPESPTRKAIFDALARLSVKTVRVTYSGSGDAGAIDSIDARKPRGRPVALRTRAVTIPAGDHNEDGPAETVTLYDAIEAWCYALLENHHGQWEIDEGADGTITLNVRTRRCILRHTDYYTAEDTTTHEV